VCSDFHGTTRGLAAGEAYRFSPQQIDGPGRRMPERRPGRLLV